MRSIHQSGHRLKIHDLHQILRTPARFLHRLTARHLGTCLARIHDPAWKFPPPRLRDETMPPHQQHPILIIQGDGYRHPLQPDNVMLKPIPVRRCDIHLRHPHPRTVKQRPLTMLTPHQRLRLLRAHYHRLTLTPTRSSTSGQHPPEPDRSRAAMRTRSRQSSTMKPDERRGGSRPLALPSAATDPSALPWPTSIDSRTCGRTCGVVRTFSTGIQPPTVRSYPGHAHHFRG